MLRSFDPICRRKPPERKPSLAYFFPPRTASRTSFGANVRVPIVSVWGRLIFMCHPANKISFNAILFPIDVVSYMVVLVRTPGLQIHHLVRSDKNGNQFVIHGGHRG